jgi:glycosyltransferase involved in cell wall biosynthesis
LKKKVFFQLVDTLAMGGTERMSVNIASAMLEAGWESHLLVSRRGGGLEINLDPGVHVHYLKKRAFFDVFAFIGILKLVLKYRPTVFHAHSTSIYWAVLVKIISEKFTLVWHDHFGLSDGLEKYPRKEILVLSRWVDLIVVVNEKLENYWRKLITQRSKDIRYIGNFPWLKLQEEPKFEQFTFLNLANLRPQKDQLTLVKASKILVEENYDFKVLLVGERVVESWAIEVENLINTYQLSDYVQVIGPSSDVSNYLAKCSAGVLSSESEGLPVALLEYGLACLPVVCTKVGQCEEVLGFGEFGILVESGNFEELSEAMKKIIQNPDRSKSLGKSFQSHVLSNYGSSGFLDTYLKFISTKNSSN